MIEIKYEDAVSVLDLGPENSKGWSNTLCPAHDDNNPSLGVKEDGGLLVVKCQTGCSREKVLKAIDSILGGSGGVLVSGAAKKTGKKAPKPPKGRHVASYLYSSVEGLPLALKKRFELDGKKTGFAWYDPQDPDVLGLPGKLRNESELPLYNIEDVVRLGKKKVIWVEGEKAADALKEAYGAVAICLPGGSASELTSEQAEPLRGRRIVLWPDNDEPGRDLMRGLADKLGSLVKEIITIMPYVPPKGDAYDYVKAGHTKEHLKEEIAVTPQDPILAELPDGYEVTVPDTGGVVKFQFLDLETKPRTLDADIVVWREMTGAKRLTYSARQNLQSSSSREGFVRQLSRHFGGPDSKDSTKAWSRIVDTAYGKVQETQRSRSPDEWVLSPQAKKSNLYLVSPLVADDGLTIPFGMGGSGKSYMALLLAVLTAVDKPDLEEDLGLTTKRHGPVLYVDYEASIARAQRRVMGIVRGLGLDADEYDTEEKLPIHYWPGGGLPMTTMVYPLRKRYSELGAVLLVVDSVSRACGVDLNSQETASAYSNAIARIGATASINIAHVTKDAGKINPFGSVFWHNDPRLTWNVRGGSIDGNTMGLIMENRKSNDDKLHDPLGFLFEFSGQDSEDNFKVNIKLESVGALENKVKFEGGTNGGNGRITHKTEILDALDDGPRTETQIKEMFPEGHFGNLNADLNKMKGTELQKNEAAGTWETSE